MDDERELRAAGDRMVAMIRRLRDLEEQKHRVPIGTPEFVELAHQVEQLSRLVFRWSGLQTQAAEAAANALLRGEISPKPMESFEPRPLDVILAAWREAQMRFELAIPGSPEAAAASENVERLREEFQAAHGSRSSADERAD